MSWQARRRTGIYGMTGRPSAAVRRTHTRSGQPQDCSLRWYYIVEDRRSQYSAGARLSVSGRSWLSRPPSSQLTFGDARVPGQVEQAHQAHYAQRSQLEERIEDGVRRGHAHCQLPQQKAVGSLRRQAILYQWYIE